MFGLNPVRQNLDLQGILQPGDPLKIVWADCSEEDFTVQAVEPGPIEEFTLLEPSSFGLRVVRAAPAPARTASW